VPVGRNVAAEHGGRPGERGQNCGRVEGAVDRDRSGAVRLSFVLPVDEPRGRVSVVGDFNGWQPGVHELRRRSNGTRSLAVTVSEGTALRFRYLAENGHWSNETEHPDVRQIGNDSLVVATLPGKAVG